MYEIDAGRKDLVDEFKRNPVGYHSGELRRLLTRMRTHPDAPPYILVCTKAQRQWRIAVKTPVRGSPVEILDMPPCTDPLEAEWNVFRLRWKAITGEELPA